LSTGRNVPNWNVYNLRHSFNVTRRITSENQKAVLNFCLQFMCPLSIWIARNPDKFIALRPDIVCNRHILRQILLPSRQMRLNGFVEDGAVFLTEFEVPPDMQSDTNAGEKVENLLVPKKTREGSSSTSFKNYGIYLLSIKKGSEGAINILYSAELDGFSEKHDGSIGFPVEVKSKQINSNKRDIKTPIWINWYFQCKLAQVETLLLGALRLPRKTSRNYILSSIFEFKMNDVEHYLGTITDKKLQDGAKYALEIKDKFKTRMEMEDSNFKILPNRHSALASLVAEIGL